MDQLPRVLRCIGDLHSYRGMHGNAVDFYVRSMQYRERAWERWEEGRRRGTTSTTTTTTTTTNGQEEMKVDDDDDGGDATTNPTTTESFASLLDGLRRKRHLVEAYALVAEELLASPEGEDVIARRPDDDVDDDYDDDEGGIERDSTVAVAMAATGATRGRETTVILAKAEDRLDYARGHYEMAREGLEDLLCQYARMATTANHNTDLYNEKEDIGYLVMTVVSVGMTIDEHDRRR